jgi:uncharacterized protein YjbI with pentapeptide repeats
MLHVLYSERRQMLLVECFQMALLFTMRIYISDFLAAAQLDDASFVNADVENATFAGCRCCCSNAQSSLPLIQSFRMARIQMHQTRHIKSCDIFRPRSDAIPAIFPGGSFTGCDLEGVVFDKRLELTGCNFSGAQLRALPMCCMCCCLLP